MTKKKLQAPPNPNDIAAEGIKRVYTLSSRQYDDPIHRLGEIIATAELFLPPTDANP